MNNNSFRRKLIRNIFYDLFEENLGCLIAFFFIFSLILMITGIALIEETTYDFLGLIILNMSYAFMVLFGLIIITALIYYVSNWFRDIRDRTIEECRK